MLFEKASRMKLRFQYKGQISVEDLWDLSVQELDLLFKGVNAQLKASKEESLLGVKSRADEIAELSIQIIKHIVETKIKEADEKVQARDRKEEINTLKEIRERKKLGGLENLSEAELDKRIAELEKGK